MAAGQPVWALATRFPRQGDWTETDYLALPEGHPRVELSGGWLDVLPMPSDKHQAILTAVLLLLAEHARSAGGWARPAGLRIRLGEGRFREPDVAFLSREHAELRGEAFWTGADLVVEIVSGSADDRARDYVVKRQEYASAGIGEYWIVDFEEGRVSLLVLRGASYVEHAVLGRGERLESPTRAGLGVAVDALLDAD